MIYCEGFFLFFLPVEETSCAVFLTSFAKAGEKVSAWILLRAVTWIKVLNGPDSIANSRDKPHSTTQTQLWTTRFCSISVGSTISAVSCQVCSVPFPGFLLPVPQNHPRDKDLDVPVCWKQSARSDCSCLCLKTQTSLQPPRSRLFSL